MPIYCFTDTESSLTIERTFSMKEAIPLNIEHCGRVYTRDIAAEHRGAKPAPGAWPMTSDALACNPEEVAEFRKASVDAGVPTEFTRDGRPILRDRYHRARYMRSRGFIDRDGGYSDNTRLD